MTSLPQHSAVLPSHRLLVEPYLAFHPERTEDCSQHPLDGLLEYGPYSRSLVSHVFDPLRIAVICPQGTLPSLSSLIRELEQTSRPKERKQYLREYRGMSKIFGIKPVLAGGNTRVELPREVDDELKRSLQPHTVLAGHLVRALSALSKVRQDYDVILILLSDRWSAAFSNPDDGFDLHDYIKATTASQALPTQMLLESSALSYSCRASVMWRLSIALYCKAGGVPWKLAHMEPDVAHVGISYAIRTNPTGGAKFVTCCSQVFDSDGAGLEFLAYQPNSDGIHFDRDNPYMTRTEMRRVMSRSVDVYQKRHAGAKPRRVFIHKTTPFKSEEVDGCFDAWSGLEGLDLIQVQQDTGWRGLLWEQPRATAAGKKLTAAPYPCLRGSYFSLSNRDALLWTQGDAPSIALAGHFYKEGKGIPAPLLVKRFAGHGSWDDSCAWILGLTKMNWNNDSLYDRLPVTLSYATVLAKTIKSMPKLSPTPYPFRLFM